MKRFLTCILAASLMLLGTQAYAQLVVGAGYLHTIENTKTTEGKAVGKPDHMNGFYLGASYNIRFSDYFGVAPGFYVNMLFQSMNNAEGGNFGGILLSGSASYNYTEVALNLPVNLTLNVPISDNVDFFAFAGPTFQYGVMARSTFNTAASVGVIHYSKGDSYNHYGKDGDGKPFNILLGGGVGVEIGDLQFLVGYDHTLMNVSKIDGYKVGRHQIKAGINFAF